jgi:hypothetical protein
MSSSSQEAIEKDISMADNEHEAEKPGADASDATEGAAHDSTDQTASGNSSDRTSSDTGKQRRPMTFSVTARGLVVGLLIAVLAGAVATFAWLYIDARSQLNEQTRTQEDYARAEKIALDYAVNAAAMNYQDLNAWKPKLVAGTSPELRDKLTEAATSMEQILVPLQWNSTAQPLTAKVRSSDGGVYVVDSFVSVQTKTVQAPEALQSTATYSVVIDRNKDWQITDVGGIGAVLESK